MNARQFHFIYAALTLLSMQYCIARQTPDIELPQLAVDVYPHLVTALEVQLPAGELMKLNENVTEQQFMCVEEIIRDAMATTEATQCSSVIIAKASADSGAVVDAESGWGDDDNEEESGSGIETDFASKVFCDEACQSVFLRAYKDCGLLQFEESAELVKDLCRPLNKDEVCFDFVTRFASVSTCTTDEDCDDVCKLGKELVQQDSNCCLRYKESKVAELFSDCEILPVQDCKNTGNKDIEIITDSAAMATSSIIMFSLCLWVVLLVAFC